MYSLADFEEYPQRVPTDTDAVLAWSLKNGYHFLSSVERAKAIADGQNFKIIGVEKK